MRSDSLPQVATITSIPPGRQGKEKDFYYPFWGSPEITSRTPRTPGRAGCLKGVPRVPAGPCRVTNHRNTCGEAVASRRALLAPLK